MQPIEVTNGNKTVIVSQWVSGDSVRYVVKPNNGGATKILKTLDGAIKAANKYVGA